MDSIFQLLIFTSNKRMGVIIEKGETELIEAVKVIAPAGMVYPLAGLDDRRFERLVYWIYKEEIEAGIWKGKFDEIRLMSGVRDGGKDCVLYKNGIQLGVIQSKHSDKDAPLMAPVLAKEIIKFGLYSLIETSTIRLYDGYLYHIAASAQFHEKTHDLIDQYDTFIDHPDFQKWTDSVIEKHASLRHWRNKYDLIKNDLRANLQKLKLEKIDGDELNKRLETDIQSIVVKGFFTVRAVVDSEGLVSLETKVDAVTEGIKVITAITEETLSAVKPMPKRGIFQAVNGYIPRSLTGESEEIAFYILGETRTLKEIIARNRKVALLGSGLLGKSTELKQLAHYLSNTEGELYVYLIRLDVAQDKPIASQIPGIPQIPQEKLVVLLDGLDEVVPEKRPNARLEIESFAREYPEALIVVSCRANIYYTDEANDDISTLPGFTSFTLQKLAWKETEILIEQRLGKDKDDFMKSIRDYDLDDLLTIPFYLNKLAEQFQKDRRIASSKAQLFEGIVRDGIRQDVDRLKPEDALKWEQRVYVALAELACIMEITGRNFATHAELSSLFSDRQLFLFVKNLGSLLQGTEQEKSNWGFIHNNFQEYLAAQAMVGRSFDQTKRLYAFEPELRTLKPTWLSTLSFYINTLKDENADKKALLKWLEKYNIAQLMMIDPGTLKAAYRLQVFKRNYDQQKADELPFHHLKFNLKAVGRFVQSDDALLFMIGELRSSANDTAKQALLRIIHSFDLVAVPVHRSELQKVLMELIYGQDDQTRTLALRVWSALFVIDLNAFDKIFSTYKDSPDSSVRSILFAIIHQQKYVAHYLSFLLDLLETINRENNVLAGQKDSTSKRYMDEQYYIEKCLLQIDTLSAIHDYLDWMLNFSHKKYFPGQLKKSFPHILALIERFADKAAFDKVKQFYRATGPYGMQQQQEFIPFFRRNNMLSEVFVQFYNSQSAIGYSDIQVLAGLADEGGIDHLVERYKNNELSLEQMEWFLRSLSDDAFELKLYFFTQINTVHPWTFPVVPDQNRIWFERDTRYLHMLFDQTLFLEEVAKPMTKLGKDRADYHELQPIRTTNYTANEMFDMAFDVLRREHDFLEIILPDVIAEVIADWPLVSMQYVYLFSKQHPKWTYTEEQMEIIQKWCNANASTTLLNDEDRHQERRGHAPTGMILVYLIRVLGFDHYPITFYLSWLNYPEWEYAVDQMAFITERCSQKEITDQMLQNLYTKAITTSAMERHLKYFQTHQHTGAAPGLYELLKDPEVYNWDEILRTYIELKGEIKQLWPLLPIVKESYHYDELIRQLTKEEPGKVKQYLEKLLDRAKPERKLAIARLLIPLQSRKGLRFYIDRIRKEKIVPDYTSHENPLFGLRSVALVGLTIELYELSYDPTVKYGDINNLRSIASTAIQNIYLAKGNAKRMAFIISAYIAWLKVKNLFRPSEIFAESIRDMKYMMQGFQHQRKITLSSAISFEEAVGIYHGLMKRI